MRGGQWQVLYLLRGLRDRGFAPLLRARGELARRAAGEGFEIAGKRWPDCDLVHVHDARSHTLAALTTRLPVVVSRRVGFPVRSGLLSRWKYRRAAHYIAVSRYVAGTLERAGLMPDRISVVYDGVPIPEYRAPVPEGPVLALLRDRMGPLVVEAARVAGAQIRSLNRIEDLAQAGMFAYVTAMQGLGSAAIAAMAAGVPVIASRVGGLPEIVEDGETGLLVDNTVAEIASAIARLRSDGDLRLRLSRRAYDRARSAFSTETMVEGTVWVYERLLG